jgi:hypothetical protein
VSQLPIENWRDLPFVITVEPTTEERVRNAVSQMAALKFLLEPPFVMPIEISL